MRRSETRLRFVGWMAMVAAIGLAGCSVLPFGGGGDLPGPADPPPVFEMEAIARLQPTGDATLTVWMTPPTPLVESRQPGSGSAARVRWTVEVLERPSGLQLSETSWVQTLTRSDSSGLEPVSRETVVPSGNLLVAVTAEDEATGAGFTQRQEVSVPELEGPLAILGPHLERLEGEWTPSISPTVPVDVDSLRARAQVVGGEGRTVRVLVERLEVDSSAAEPPFELRLPSGSLVVRGLQVGPAIRDTTDVQTRALRAELADLEVLLPSLRVGSYRLRVEVEDVSADRFLVVRRVGFPTVERVGDLVAAMRYITTESEMRTLTARLDPFLQRRAFDRFWGEQIPDRRLAASTVRAYAERVEEANRRYSNQKDGWMTDQGMAWILFGAPQQVERSLDTERWIYTSGPVSGLALEFVATPDLPEGWPYEVWVLRRGPAYDVAWQRARRAWRRGDVP